MPSSFVAALARLVPLPKRVTWGVSKTGAWVIELNGYRAEVDSDATGWWLRITPPYGGTYHHPRPFRTDAEAKAAALDHIRN
jgi:hypothetical protein